MIAGLILSRSADHERDQRTSAHARCQAKPALVSDYKGAAARQRAVRAHEFEAQATSLLGLTKIDNGYAVLVMLDETTEVQEHGWLLHAVEIAQKDGILQVLAVSLHGLEYLPQPGRMSDVVSDEIAPTGHSRQRVVKAV